MAKRGPRGRYPCECVKQATGHLGTEAGREARFPNHQALMIDARLHPADVVAHNEEDREPARRLEYLGYIRHFAGGTDAERPTETNDHQIASAHRH